jgi:hypothetical protein
LRPAVITSRKSQDVSKADKQEEFFEAGKNRHVLSSIAGNVNKCQSLDAMRLRRRRIETSNPKSKGCVHAEYMLEAKVRSQTDRL